MQQLSVFCPYCRSSKIYLPELSSHWHKSACVQCNHPMRFAQGRVLVHSIPDAPGCASVEGEHFWFPMKGRFPVPVGSTILVILPLDGLGRDLPLSVVPEGRKQIMLHHIQTPRLRDILIVFCGSFGFVMGVHKIAPGFTLICLLIVLPMMLLMMAFRLAQKPKLRPEIKAWQAENHLRYHLILLDAEKTKATNRLQSAEQMLDRLTLMQGQATELNQVDFLDLIGHGLQQVGDYHNLLQQLINVLEKRMMFCDLELSAHRMAEALPVDSLEWNEALTKQQDFLNSELKAFTPTLEDYYAVSTRTV